MTTLLETHARITRIFPGEDFHLSFGVWHRSQKALKQAGVRWALFLPGCARTIESASLDGLIEDALSWKGSQEYLAHITEKGIAQEKARVKEYLALKTASDAMAGFHPEPETFDANS